jgi:beta-lactamase class A
MPASGAPGEVMSEATLAGLEARLGGRLGVALVGEDGVLRRSHRGDERFAMCSTFKLALSAAILEQVDDGDLSLDAEVPIDESDLLSYAPVVTERVGEGRIRVDELAVASVTLSDNSAANLLLERVGGPAGLTAFFRRQGDPVTRLDRIEPDLNENRPGDERDTTTPEAMATLVQRLVLGTGLSAESRELLRSWLEQTSTGLQRIRAGLPDRWRAGDKTGTCGTAYNDVAVVWPPEGEALVLVVYIDRPAVEAGDVDDVFAELGGLAAEFVAERVGGSNSAADSS